MDLGLGIHIWNSGDFFSFLSQFIQDDCKSVSTGFDINVQLFHVLFGSSSQGDSVLHLGIQVSNSCWCLSKTFPLEFEYF